MGIFHILVIDYCHGTGSSGSSNKCPEFLIIKDILHLQSLGSDRISDMSFEACGSLRRLHPHMRYSASSIRTLWGLNAVDLIFRSALETTRLSGQCDWLLYKSVHQRTSKYTALSCIDLSSTQPSPWFFMSLFWGQVSLLYVMCIIDESDASSVSHIFMWCISKHSYRKLHP